MDQAFDIVESNTAAWASPLHRSEINAELSGTSARGRSCQYPSCSGL
jgi:hypothetical protein